MPERSLNTKKVYLVKNISNVSKLIGVFSILVLGLVKFDELD